MAEIAAVAKITACFKMHLSGSFAAIFTSYNMTALEPDYQVSAPVPKSLVP
ncbi:hypothetical protein [Paenibacillus gansuensis]|uniref:Uncharacterized protein n=1 Tax=Paenibacillus gansuensis TaxID=306542 RepID=A0ABW5PD66_9BACL